MDMIGGYDVVQHTQSISLFGFIQPMSPTNTVFGKLKEKFLLMTTVGLEQGCSYVAKPMDGRERRCARPDRANNDDGHEALRFLLKAIFLSLKRAD